jgi:hypothetical protein
MGAGASMGAGAGPTAAPSAGVVCNQCGHPGHVASQCQVPREMWKSPAEFQPRRNMRPLEQVQCFKCGGSGHYANVCPNPRSAPPPGGYSLPGRPDVRILDPRARGRDEMADGV